MNVAVRELQALIMVGSLGGLSDEQLLDRFVEQRDDAVFEAIVRRHGPMVWGVCRRVLRDSHDAEDAFQATFIVLARKAASVMIREKLGHWLYRVAYQTAMKAKSIRTRRRMRQVRVSEAPEPIVVSDDLRDAFAESLDGELSRLPDKYRIPIVLCGLEGRTHQEAAEQLGWPIGTVSSRLSRAKSMLAERLTRRGLALPGGALAVLLTQESATAGMPTKLIVSTARAASQVVARGAVPTGLVSAEVATMTQGVLRMMLLSRITVATAMLMVVSALAVGGTGLAYQAQANGPPQKEDLQRVLDGKGKDLGFQTHPDLPNGRHIVGLPSVTSWGPGRLDFVATGDDGVVYHRVYDRGRYSPADGWEAYPALPGGHRAAGPLSVTSWGSGRLDFLVTGDDGIIYHRYYDLMFNPDTGYGPAEGWEAYPALPGGHRVVGPPRMVCWGPLRLDFLVTGDDGIVYHRFHETGIYGPAEGWEAYPALPGGHRVVGPPSLASWGSGRLDFLVTGDDGIVYHRYHDQGLYGPPEEWEAYPALPGGHRAVGSPTMVSWGSGRLDFLVTGDDGIVYHRYHDQGQYGPPEEWETFPALPGGHHVNGPPRMVSVGSGVLRFFATGDDGAVRHRSYSFRTYKPEGAWEDWPIHSLFDVETGYLSPFKAPENNQNPGK